jgi:hypothetical protein
MYFSHDEYHMNPLNRDGEPMTPARPESVLTLALAMRKFL